MAKDLPKGSKDLADKLDEKTKPASIYSSIIEAYTDSTKEERAIAGEIEQVLYKKFQKTVSEETKKYAAEFAKADDDRQSDMRMVAINDAVDKIILHLPGNRLKTTNKIKRYMLLTNNGAPKPDATENIRLILLHDKHYKKLLRYNEFTEVPEIKKPQGGYEQVPDDWTPRLTANVERYYRYTPTQRAVQGGTVLAAESNSYDPIKQRLESGKWDGKHRLETYFIDYLGAENIAYNRAVTKMWFIALVARVYHPGAKCDMIPVLTGPQGIGKSRSAGILCPPDYFIDDLATMGTNKDDLIKLHNAWVVELGELDAMNKTGISKIKQFSAATADNFRRPYGINSMRHPRKNMFIGTVNTPEFLHDLTGNRRFYPIKCGVQNPSKKLPDPNDYNNPEILQVLYEAKSYFDADPNQPLMLSADMEEQAHKKQAEATAIDEQASLMQQYVDMLVPDNWNNFTTYERQQYFDRVRENGLYSHVTKTDDGKAKYEELDPGTLHKMQSFANQELLEVVFHQNGLVTQSGGRGGLSAKIAMVFGNDNNWKTSNHCKYHNKQVRGYKRK